MPPQTTQAAPAVAASGFRYTPPSYLLRSSGKQEQRTSASTLSTASMSTSTTSLRSTEAKPWNNSEENDIADAHMCMKKGTSVDAHFSYRVKKKQNRYRNILQGADVVDEETTPSEDSSFTKQLQQEVRVLAEVKETQESQAKVSSEARESRKSRISGGGIAPTAETMYSTTTTAANDSVRSLRAQRLRSSLLQRTPEEVDACTKLEQRRKAQLALERAARDNARESKKNESIALERERLRLKQERVALEQAKQEAALALAKQWREKNSVERRSSPVSDLDSLEEVLDKQPKKHRPTKRHARHYHRKTKRTNKDSDLQFLDSIGEALRESGLLQSCVGQCFGGDGGVEPDIVPSSDSSSSQPSLKMPPHHAHYAKYRE